MKKLLIFPGNYLPHIGGLETHVDEFAYYMSKRGYEITIFTPQVSGGSFYEERFNRVNVIRYPAFFLVNNWAFPKFWRFLFWKMLFQVYFQDVDVVMTRTRFFFNSLLGVFVAKFRFKFRKLIHVEHGSEYVSVSNKFVVWFSYFYDLIFGRFVFFMSDRIVAISDVCYKFVRSNFVKKRHIDLIHRGVDISKYDVSAESLKGVSLLFVGRLYKWKGVVNTIRAFKSSSAYSRAHLYIAGYGEDEQRIIDEIGDCSRIHFLGKVSFERSAQLMRGADVYVHSSYPGGALSSSLLQAMYCKCCVVASPNEGAREVVNENNGILLKSNSVQSLRFGIEKAVSSSVLRDKLSSKSHEDIKFNFDWERVIDSYEEIIL